MQHQGRFYLISQYRDRSHWVQNIKHDPDISFKVGSDSFHGLGRMVDNSIEPELAKIVSKLMHDKHKWSDGLIVELRPEPGTSGAENLAR